MTELVLPDVVRSGVSRPREVRTSAYWFTGPEGRVSLGELFGDRRRLVVQHAMPDRSPGEAVADREEIAAALRAGGTRLVLVSAAPYEKLAQYGRHLGWDLPVYSAAGTAFAADFPAQRRLAGLAPEPRGEEPGLTFFERRGRFVHHLDSIVLPYLDFLVLAGVADA
ncbi:DUF899 family protein [Amycolatopsis sp. NPDC098790]|uniref:DUF899 family protein n=1 Tax=Amycolatopsis sp. NPDC098790 TaxID=3363939 RepID=UPI003826762F